MSRNRGEQRRARELSASLGISYTRALHIAREEEAAFLADEQRVAGSSQQDQPPTDEDGR